MKNTDMIKAQNDFIAARDALAIADKGYHDELASTGVKAKIDAWVDGEPSTELQAADDTIYDKHGVRAAHAEMSRAELALVTCLCDAIEKRSPAKHGMVATLREHIATTTRYCPKRAELVALALDWHW
jgi:hypothetical protein